MSTTDPMQRKTRYTSGLLLLISIALLALGIGGVLLLHFNSNSGCGIFAMVGFLFCPLLLYASYDTWRWSRKSCEELVAMLKHREQTSFIHAMDELHRRRADLSFYLPQIMAMIDSGSQGDQWKAHHLLSRFFSKLLPSYTGDDLRRNWHKYMLEVRVSLRSHVAAMPNLKVSDSADGECGLVAATWDVISGDDAIREAERAKLIPSGSAYGVARLRATDRTLIQTEIVIGGAIRCVSCRADIPFDIEWDLSAGGGQRSIRCGCGEELRLTIYNVSQGTGTCEVFVTALPASWSATSSESPLSIRIESPARNRPIMGGANEPYCSPACYSDAGKALALGELTPDKVARFAGGKKCALCGRPTGDA